MCDLEDWQEMNLQECSKSRANRAKEGKKKKEKMREGVKKVCESV